MDSFRAGILAPPSKQHDEFDACLMKMHGLKRIVKPSAIDEYERPSDKNPFVRCNTRKSAARGFAASADAITSLKQPHK